MSPNPEESEAMGKASLLGALSTFISASIVVAFPWMWVDGWTRFGWKSGEPWVLAGGTVLAVVALVFSWRGWRRFVTGMSASRAPLLARLVPLLWVSGLAFGIYMGLSIHQRRWEGFVQQRDKLCSQRLCDSPERGTKPCLEESPEAQACRDSAAVCLRLHQAESGAARRASLQKCMDARG